MALKTFFLAVLSAPMAFKAAVFRLFSLSLIAFSGISQPCFCLWFRFWLFFAAPPCPLGGSRPRGVENRRSLIAHRFFQLAGLQFSGAARKQRRMHLRH